MLLRELGQSEIVIVAFSGGADSQLTLQLILEAAATLPSMRVILWYMHHYSTPIESERAEILAATMVRAISHIGQRVEQIIHSIPVAPRQEKLKRSWEHTASLLRRKYLLRLRERTAQSSGRAVAVVTGHNYSDYLETLALRQARQIPSESWPTLEMRDTHTGFLRPLYKKSRDEVRTEINNLRIRYFNDPSNSDRKFARNRIRHSSGNNLNSLADQAPSIDNALVDSLKRIGPREFRVARQIWDSWNYSSRRQCTLLAFRMLAVVKIFSRGMFSLGDRLPLCAPPFYAEFETIDREEMVVFRKGLGNRLSLPQPTIESHYVRGNEVSRGYTIKKSYGHKSLKKIFSELRLSSRQLRRTIVYLEPNDSRRARSYSIAD
jgi:tRNA(Ile)-lysidine synthase TilS/MesJ